MSKISFISIPAIMVYAVPINAITALLSSPDKAKKKSNDPFWSKIRSGSCWLLFVTLFGSLSMLKALTSWPRHDVSEACYPKFPGLQSYDEKRLRMEPQQQLIEDFHVSLPPHALNSNLTQAEKAFWRQPDSLKLYKPCLNPSEDYQKASTLIVQQRQKFLIVVVSGGLNQQRHQIVDAVVIARILEAALLLPIMQVNAIWQDDSEFSDIFDSEHFKHTLRNDVKVVSSLPSTHIRTRPVEQSKTPLNANPQWFRSYCLKRLNRHGILLLRGLDSRLSKDLPSDLQKLRCKVAFHALKFAAPLQSLANKLVQRMWSQGPYLALHLRLEKDVWVRTGCLPGIGPKYDHESKLERIRNPHLLTGRSNMSSEERRLAGLCPLNAAEVVRLLKALGASEKTRIYIAGGEPFGGIKALEPLQKGFSHLYNKDNLARPGELEPFRNKASSLAAIDYILCLNSDVFMPSHGGNMARSLKGHRAYTGHRKHITPNKRQMIPYLLNHTLSEREFDKTIRKLHEEFIGQPAKWMGKKGGDVLGHPVPDCVCQQPSTT